MDAPVQYMEELRSELSLYPTWLPFDRVEVGSFGTLKRGKLYVDGRLEDLGVKPQLDEQRTDGNINKSRAISFRAATNVQATAGVVDLSAGVEAKCEREHAWVFAARGVSTVAIANMTEVRRVVNEARARGEWQDDWLLVTELRRTSLLNVLVARSRNASFRVVAKGSLAAADVLLGEDAVIEGNSDDLFMVTNHRNGTPLYGVRKLQGLFRKQLKPASTAKKDELALEIADDESFGF